MIKKVKAFSQKRKGAPVFQMYYDLHKLVRKSSVVSEVSSWIFRATPSSSSPPPSPPPCLFPSRPCLP
jgi:formate hydrogenlyase subunit 4